MRHSRVISSAQAIKRGILRPGTAVLAAVSFWGFCCCAADEKAGSKPPPPPPEALEWMNEITRLGPGIHRDLAPVRISYGLSWNNVLNAGELEVALTRSEEEPETALIGSAEGRSNGLARILWPYDVAARSVVERQSLKPRLFEISESERGKNFQYWLQFSPHQVSTRTSSIEKKSKEGAAPDPKVSEKTYRYDFVQDVLSAVLYIRSQELPNGDKIKAVISPFNRPYHTEFEVLGRETRKIKGEKIDAIRLAIEIRKINSDRTLQDYEKMKTATIWLSDDDFRLPLEVQADIFIGYISARMNERQWLSSE